jgi:hypothetical protein
MSHTVVKYPPLPPSPARESQEHFIRRVDYVLNQRPFVRLPTDVIEKVLVTIAKDAEVHKDWLDGLPEPQQSRLTSMLGGASR